MAEGKKTDIKLPDPSKLIVSSSPHLHNGSSVRKIMWLVILALMPSCIMGVYYFGFAAFRVLAVCVISSLIFEYIFARMMGRNNDWKDGSAIITGLLMGMLLSAGMPWWVCVIGCFIAIVFGKQVYGGIGFNPFNPACVGRIALIIAFPKMMTTWVPTRFMDKSFFVFDKSLLSPEKIEQIKGMSHLPFFHSVIDGVTCATPLGVVQTPFKLGTATEQLVGTVTDWQHVWQYAIGNIGGCIGETSAIALIIGGIFLIAMKVIKWYIPVSYIGTVAVFSTIVHFSMSPPALPGMVYQVLTGGLLIGAFFMATDMVTTPMTCKGGIIFGVGCGIITCVIRNWGGYPEGVMFSIVLMNALTPLIDRVTANRPFGKKQTSKTEA
ncbi:MAG: RnfABCDGE type electron transport complex subunit D [Victivallales bacterium]|nr:RnfABCDGE type electron transport complex subunit D [Victivallales bacterium]